eukprot:TRINITY_DN49910_c0_g1_i1.p1 TRINITY_DN49910_c0_g1~~TRINITY_DN49910_c0_g1_i1.p1  ORF type:complete len:352 (-),score=52.36 TRINITY_DN49910_c0_g1_i1:89-1093(-)
MAVFDSHRSSSSRSLWMVSFLKGSIVLLSMPHPCSAVEWPTYDEETTRVHLEYARAAFCQKPKVESWSCGEACDGVPSKPRAVRYFGDPAKNVPGYVAMFAEKKCVIAFRGSVSLANWISDFTFLTKTWPLSENGAAWCPGCRAHLGFAIAWDAVRDDAMSFIVELGCRNVTVVGHSLGGAVATLAAVDIRATGPRNLVVSNIYTFGCPRVGNKAFTEAFAGQPTAPNINDDNGTSAIISWRVVYHHDPVPHLSNPFVDMTHVGTEVHYYTADSSRYKVCDGGEDPTCSDSLSKFQLFNLDHIWYFNKTFAHRLMSSACTDATTAALQDQYTIV